MANNLVSLVIQFLTPEMIGRIASALGLDRNNTQTAIGAVVPTLLAGFSNVAVQPGGPLSSSSRVRSALMRGHRRPSSQTPEGSIAAVLRRASATCWW